MTIMQDFAHLIEARASYPFSDLGVFRTELGDYVRVFIPDAEKVEVVDAKNKCCVMLLPMGDGIFAHPEPQNIPTHYKLRVTSEYGKRIIYDPYAFKDQAYHAVHFIDHAAANVYQQLGAQQVVEKIGRKKVPAIRFAVFAPNASAVSVIGDFNGWHGAAHPMQKTDLGYWVLIIPEAQVGHRYKYAIKDAQGHALPHKADPIGFQAEQYPSHASVIVDHTAYTWSDSEWQKRKHMPYSQPMSIYEVQLASWRRPSDGRKYLSYRELAVELVEYVVDMGYTHIELMPISEYPFDGSWGYQPLGLFAPTSRFGTIDDFKFFVDACHQANIGVIIDWVPAHFPEDGHGLARFDGSCVYEYQDPKKGWHPDWNSCIYDFGKNEVRQFLVANALFWCDKFHIDGLRVDAVASMLYLDYSRNEGEWIPNVDGGNHNYEAISLLRWMNQEVYAAFPKAITIAEESTSFPRVSRPVDMDGLGFGFKWNMGWMHDSLHYISKDPAYRRYHHNDITFSMVYAFDENFVLPISHDEVVYGKGSLLGKMPGDEWQQAANLRAYAAFMFAHPGKKLNFMGNEFGQFPEWDHDGQLAWEHLNNPKHVQIQRLYKTLNHTYKNTTALHAVDHEYTGFAWLDHHDADRSILSFRRFDPITHTEVTIICNFTPVPQASYIVGVAQPGEFQCILNTDAEMFGGSAYPIADSWHSLPKESHGLPNQITISLPPLSCLYIVHAND